MGFCYKVLVAVYPRNSHLVRWPDFSAYQTLLYDSLAMADMKANLLNELAEYVCVLSNSLEGTKRAEDRSACTSHLAEAAVIFQYLMQSDFSMARERVMAEQQAYGRSFLDGETGQVAEAAFAKLLRSFERSG